MTIRAFERGSNTRSCESRVNAEGDRFELVVTRNGETRVEVFASLEAMLTREREMVSGWTAHCWRQIAPAQKP